MRLRVGRACAAGALVLALGGCGTASEPYAPTGIDELVIPTPSPSPGDFVATIDNPLLSLSTAGASYRISGTGVDTGIETGMLVGSRVATAEPGPDIEGVATTAVRYTTGDTGVSLTLDYLAQDLAGNVWWFGREGSWQAGVDGAEAGLLMAAHPRLGDSYRSSPDAVAEVVSVDARMQGPDGDHDHVVEILETGTDGRIVRSSYAVGVGLVRQEATIDSTSLVLDLES